jgi:serine/threonine protein kinase
MVFPPPCLLLFFLAPVLQRLCCAGSQGLVSGSLAYCPPEVVLAHSTGDASSMDPSVDIWALAVCVYECLAGPVLSRYGGAEEAINCARGEQPYPWEWEEELVPLEWSCARGRGVIERCLARSPGNRPAAKEVAVALQELLDSLLSSCDPRPAHAGHALRNRWA